MSNCGPYTLPAITGTTLAGNEKYYTLPNGGGTVLSVGSQVTTTQTIYAYGGTVGCADEKSFLVTISAPVNAGSDNGAGKYNYRDIRDDRVLTYFNLGAGQTKTFKVRLQAAYRGMYYLPAVSCQAMYEPREQARTKGSWVNVEKSDE